MTAAVFIAGGFGFILGVASGCILLGIFTQNSWSEGFRSGMRAGQRGELDAPAIGRKGDGREG